MLHIDLDGQYNVTTALRLPSLLTNLIMQYLLHGDDYRDPERVNDRGPYLVVSSIDCERRTATGTGYVG